MSNIWDLVFGGQNAQNTVLAAPAVSVGPLSPRVLVATDIPSLAASIITSGQIATARGGTGADLSSSGGATYVLAQDASHVISARALVAADVPSLAASIITSGVLALARGGNTFAALGDLIYGGVAAAPTVLTGNTTTTKNFLTQTGAAGPVSAAPAWGTIVIGDLPSGYNAWSNEANATTNLALNNAAYTTTFNQTSNVAWLWANTTTATGGTTNASPLLELAANYWTGSASAQDLWTIGSSLLAGTSGISTLTFSHSGSSPASNQNNQIQFPTSHYQTPSLIGSGGGTGSGITVGCGTASPLIINCAGSGGIRYLDGYLSGNEVVALTYTTGDQSLLLKDLGIGPIYLSGNTVSNATVLISLGNANNIVTTGSGSYIGINMGAAIFNGTTTSPFLNWSPTAGTATFTAAQIIPTINQATISDTVVGVTLVSNVVYIAFSTTNAFTTGQNIVAALITTTAVNGTFVLTSQVTRSGSPYTTSAYSEVTGVMTLTIGTHSVVANDWVYLAGFSNATWLNGQFVKVTSVVTNTSITFTDLTGHATTSGSDTGKVYDNYITYPLTNGNITATADTGTVTQRASGSYTALNITVKETSLAGTSNKLIDCYAGSVGTTEVWALDNLGAMYMILAAAAAPTSSGTAGTLGQIVRYGGVLYFCSASGTAGAATWNSLNMSVV